MSEDSRKCDLEWKWANGNMEKNCAVWTADSVCTLLKLYESKLGMLKTPKKKTRIWIAISDNLKDYDIVMSPDQVRWKINALTKKYKQCLDSGQHSRFKYFTELNNIYSQYNLTYYTSELIHKKYTLPDNICHSVDHEIRPESKAIIELRKNRLADKIESDRCQSKVRLEKQWLEYLKNQEDQRLLKDKINERKLQLREKKLELRKRELETRESTELRKLQLTEQEQNEALKLEREKYEMLREMYS